MLLTIPLNLGMSFVTVRLASQFLVNRLFSRLSLEPKSTKSIMLVLSWPQKFCQIFHVASESALTERTDLNLSIPAVTLITKGAGFRISLIFDD